MNNVWSSIAVNALRARRQARPLLELFNGYSRSYSERNAGCFATQHISRPRCRRTKTPSTHRIPPCQQQQHQSFSAIAFLSARAKKPPRQAPTAKREPNAAQANPNLDVLSKIERATTVASHTEGLPPEEQEPAVTWRDYDPEAGMPLSGGELPQLDINRVFGGEDLDADTGNYILSVMQWRRISGALIDSGLDFPRRSGVTREQALQALQYVRGLDIGFDEQAAGQRWAEEESLRLQEEIQQRAIKVGIYKRDPEYYEGEVTDQGTAEGRERSGESVLRTHREEREAQWEQEQAELRTKQGQEELAALHSTRGPLELAGGVQPSVAVTTTAPGGITIGAGPRSAWLAPVERKPWVKYYEDQANIIKDNILPRISVLGRLGPSLLVAVATMGLCLFLSDNYTPPPKSARLWPETPPAVATLTFLTSALALGFAASRMPWFWRSLNKYCTIVPAYPHAVSVLGYMLRHDTLVHLAVNTATLWAFGLTLHEDVGRGTFLAFFFAAGAAGGFTSLAGQVLMKQWTSYAFGVSAAALGVVAATCTLRPEGTLKVGTWEVPFAAWVLLVLLGGIDVVAAVRGLKTGVDHFGHLGGIATGMAGAVYLRQRAHGGGPNVMGYRSAGVKVTEKGGVAPSASGPV